MREKKIFLIIFFIIFFINFSYSQQKVRIKDITKIRGVAYNKLIGFGIVVGLEGTGDRNKGITDQALANMLKGITSLHISKDKIRTQNAAVVMVTAELPPFAKSGDTIDVLVSSIGDASSLQGGTLILTALKGLDGKIYAVAQGPLSIGGLNLSGGGGKIRKNHAVVGRVVNGATVVRETPYDFNSLNQITLVLNKKDYVTSSRICDVINKKFRLPIAKTIDGSTIRVDVPYKYINRVIDFISIVNQLEVEPDEKAKIIINERTGTVVINNNVKLNAVAISHANISITIKNKVNKLGYLKGGATLQDLVDALNLLGVSSRDLISILQALIKAGAINAEIEVM